MWLLVFRIRYLDMSNNKLSGSIPDSLGNLTPLLYAIEYCVPPTVDVNVIGAS